MEADPKKNVATGSAVAAAVPSGKRLPPTPVLKPGGTHIPPPIVPPVSQALPYEPRKPHFFTIYKRGLGYATRMGTMAGVALLAAVTAQFMYDYLPTWGLPKRPALPFFSVIGAVVLVMGLIAFIITNRPKIVDFLIATDAEMKKVNWTTKAELIGSTKVVIFFVFLMALVLFIFDTFFGYFFFLIKVLKFGPFGGGG